MAADVIFYTNEVGARKQVIKNNPAIIAFIIIIIIIIIVGRCPILQKAYIITLHSTY
jgi:hypothetical protein